MQQDYALTPENKKQMLAEEEDFVPDFDLMSKDELEAYGLQTFENFMNQMAIDLQLRYTPFAVPHGMHHDSNFS